jgi:protease-4
VAHPTSITGSIGVYMGYIRLENLFRKLGVDEEIIKSGGHKDMGSPFRELTEEERAILKGMVSIVFDRFKSIVLEGRGDKVNAHLKVIADGRVFIGSQAKDVGLVDEIGYLDEAVAKISSLSGVQDPTVVRYSARVSILENLMNDLGGIRPPAISDLTKDPYCGLMYLWRPGTMGK